MASPTDLIVQEASRHALSSWGSLVCPAGQSTQAFSAGSTRWCGSQTSRDVGAGVVGAAVGSGRRHLSASSGSVLVPAGQSRHCQPGSPSKAVTVGLSETDSWK